MGDIHLQQRNSIYYFRIRLPHDIAPYFSRKELWKSLKTKNYKSAKTTISKLLFTTERLFLHLRSGMYTDTQMKQLVKDYLHAYLDRTESIRSIGIVRYETEGQSPIDAETSVKAIEDLIESSKHKLLTNDFSGILARVGWYIEEKGLELDEGSVEYTTFCREILKAEIEALKVEKERMSGNYDNRYDNFLENAIAPEPIVVEQPATSNLPSAPIVTLSKIIADNIKEAELGGNWNEKTKAENESIYKVIVDVLGDVDIKILTHQTMMQFRDNLSKLPPNRDKVVRFKGKTIDQILAMKDVPAMSRTTLNKYLVRTSSLFKWAAKHGYVHNNIAEGLSLPKVRRADQEREAYSTEDIKKILDHLDLDKANPHQFWIPIIGMYQGMRLDEICQLYVSDIMVMDEVPCINVNSDDDKKLKNTASERVTGFRLSEMLDLLYQDIDYQNNQIHCWINKGDRPRSIPMTTRVKSILLARQGEGRHKPFSVTKYQADKCFAWVRKQMGLEGDGDYVIHACRHTCASKLVNSAVDLYVVKEWLGHSTIKITERYAHLDPSKLVHAVEALE